MCKTSKYLSRQEPHQVDKGNAKSFIWAGIALETSIHWDKNEGWQAGKQLGKDSQQAPGLHSEEQRRYTEGGEPYPFTWHFILMRNI